MKIIKKTTTENKEELNELFGKKKAAEPAPPPEKPGINRDWDEHYKMLEAIRKSGVSAWLAGSYFVSDSGLPEELARKIWFSWIENYDKLADKFNWQKED
jgi:hypothetical protein